MLFLHCMEEMFIYNKLKEQNVPIKRARKGMKFVRLVFHVFIVLTLGNIGYHEALFYSHFVIFLRNLSTRYKTVLCKQFCHYLSIYFIFYEVLSLGGLYLKSVSMMPMRYNQIRRKLQTVLKYQFIEFEKNM